MNEEARSRMFLCTIAGLACLGFSLQLLLITYLRHIGVEWWITTLALPMGAGTGILSVAIAARMWKF